MTRRQPRSRLTSHTTIGAITVLILMLAMFLAYNANNGLPFVPAYHLNVELPDAAGLNPTDGVLIGGDRVGYVGSITGARLPDGRPVAVVHVKLETSLGHLPVDSTDLVRPVSPLGEKYLEITRGTSGQTYPDGATIPLSHTYEPVEIDDFFNIFDRRTRMASRSGLNSFGDGFAGRGSDLNEFFAQVKPIVDHLLPVMRNIMDPRTRWAQLFPSLEQSASEVAPVAAANADVFSAMDLTFTPLSGATSALQATIQGGPPSLRTATQQLPAQAQFMADNAALFHRFRPAFKYFAQASAQLAPAEAAGLRALPQAPSLNSRLTATLASLQSFVDDGRTLPGLTLLTETAALIEPTIAFAAPAQTSCNYFALFFRNLASALSESDAVGSMLRVLAVVPPQLPNSEAGPSSAPANGPAASSIKGISAAQASLVDDSFLHSNPYPNTAAPGQPRECVAGNEVYLPGHTVIGNPSRIEQRSTERTRRVLP